MNTKIDYMKMVIINKGRFRDLVTFKNLALLNLSMNI